MQTPADAVEANARLTGSLGALLLVLFAAEGLTIVLRMRGLLSTHIFIGMLIVPPVLLKMASTGYRFARYYRGDPAFVHRGPPMWLLRISGPFVIITTVSLFATGIADAVMVPRPFWANFGHKVSFVLWFGFMTIHVVGHLRETPALATADWRRDRPVAGRAPRALGVVAALGLGLALGVWSLSWNLHR